MMTLTMLNAQLSSLGVQKDEWVALETVVPMVFLAQDGNCYTNDSTARYKFNSSKELLEIAYGSLDENGTFISKHNETEDYTPDSFIVYDLIAGLIRSVYKGPMGGYYNKPI